MHLKMANRFVAQQENTLKYHRPLNMIELKNLHSVTRGLVLNTFRGPRYIISLSAQLDLLFQNKDCNLFMESFFSAKPN